MTAIQETITNALLGATAPRKDAPFPIRQFAKRAVVTLQAQKVLPSTQEIIPTRRAPHGGGISQGSLRMSHNTPSGVR